MLNNTKTFGFHTLIMGLKVFSGRTLELRERHQEIPLKQRLKELWVPARTPSILQMKELRVRTRTPPILQMTELRVRTRTPPILQMKELRVRTRALHTISILQIDLLCKRILL